MRKNIPLYFLFVFLFLFFLLRLQRYYINVIKSNFVSKNSYFFMIGVWNLAVVFTNYLHVNFPDIANFHRLIVRYFAFLSQRYYINIEKANFISKILLFFERVKKKKRNLTKWTLFFIGFSDENPVLFSDRKHKFFMKNYADRLFSRKKYYICRMIRKIVLQHIYI